MQQEERGVARSLTVCLMVVMRVPVAARRDRADLSMPLDGSECSERGSRSASEAKVVILSCLAGLSLLCGL